MINKIGIIIIVVGIGAYFWMLNSQQQAAAELCNRYPTGSTVDDLSSLEGTSRLTQMGPIQDPDIPGLSKIIYCASMTMCDTSCSLEIENNTVKSAIFTDF